MAKSNGSTQAAQDVSFADFAKFMPAAQMPPFNMEAAMEVQRRNAQALTEAGQRVFENMQAVIRRQNEMVRESWKETSELLGEVMQPGSPEEKVARSSEITKAVFDKAMSNGRELAEMVTRSNFETAEAFSNCVSEALDQLRHVCTKNGNGSGDAR